ncbi:MAG TPA: hypothetical protein VN721_02725 [Flavipsychrobacter sp.]|nr:hypothetical protein [Flavipsychrobacter sp.]
MDTTNKVERKVGINTLISWGASVVIIGVMFKILHWDGAEWMIGIGLAVESFLFFILGFDSLKSKDNNVIARKQEAAPTAELEKLLATSINPATIERLRIGFEQFTKTVDSVNQVEGSTAVMQDMLQEMIKTTAELSALSNNLAQINMVYKAQLEAFRKS